MGRRIEEAIRSWSPRERRINSTPTSIDQVSFARVGGDLSISFNNGVHSSIDIITPELATHIGGNPITEPIITINFSVQNSDRRIRRTGYYFDSLGKITLRGKGKLETEGKVPTNIQKKPGDFLSQLTTMLESVDTKRVGVDSNWGWIGDSRDTLIRDHINGYTTPIKDWVTAYQEAKQTASS